MYELHYCRLDGTNSRTGQLSCTGRLVIHLQSITDEEAILEAKQYGCYRGMKCPSCGSESEIVKRTVKFERID